MGKNVSRTEIIGADAENGGIRELWGKCSPGIIKLASWNAAGRNRWVKSLTLRSLSGLIREQKATRIYGEKRFQTEMSPVRELEYKQRRTDENVTHRSRFFSVLIRVACS